MPQKRADDFLEFSFELDPRLAARTNVFRFVVRLSPSDNKVTSASVPDIHQDPVSAAGIQSRTVSAFVMCMPEDGTNPLTAVGPSSEICVIGNATMAIGPPDEVCAMIYSPPLGSYPATPPTGHSKATMVNIGSPAPWFDPPEFCGDVNFVFHPQFGNELQGAAHSEVGEQNHLVLWQRRGSSCSLPHIIPFRGITASGSDCRGSGPDFVHHASPTITADHWPGKLWLSYKSQAFGSRNIPLVREVVPRIGVVEWKSCSKACPDMRWKLWVALHEGQPYAVVALNSLFGSRLEVPLVWRTSAFAATIQNELECDNPSEVPEDMLRIFVRGQ